MEFHDIKIGEYEKTLNRKRKMPDNSSHVVHPLPERASSILLEAFPPCRGEVKSVQLTANDYGVESGATVSSDGLQVVNSGASARGMTIAGGEEYVASGGTASSTKLASSRAGPVAARFALATRRSHSFAILRSSAATSAALIARACSIRMRANSIKSVEPGIYHVVAPAERVVPVPDNVSNEDAAQAFGCQQLTSVSHHERVQQKACALRHLFGLFVQVPEYLVGRRGSLVEVMLFFGESRLHPNARQLD
jgi:autotransporter passenger strand-loop-strand repeat protein